MTQKVFHSMDITLSIELKVTTLISLLQWPSSKEDFIHSAFDPGPCTLEYSFKILLLSAAESSLRLSWCLPTSSVLMPSGWLGSILDLYIFWCIVITLIKAGLVPFSNL